MTCGAAGTLRNDRSETVELSTTVIVGYVKVLVFVMPNIGSGEVKLTMLVATEPNRVWVTVNGVGLGE